MSAPTTAEIRAVRWASGLSLNAFGARIGVHGRTVHAWERGEYAPLAGRWHSVLLNLPPLPRPSAADVTAARLLLRLGTRDAGHAVRATANRWSTWELGIHRMNGATWALFLHETGLPRSFSADYDPLSIDRSTLDRIIG